MTCDRLRRLSATRKRPFLPDRYSPTHPRQSVQTVFSVRRPPPPTRHYCCTATHRLIFAFGYLIFGFFVPESLLLEVNYLSVLSLFKLVLCVCLVICIQVRSKFYVLLLATFFSLFQVLLININYWRDIYHHYGK